MPPAEKDVLVRFTVMFFPPLCSLLNDVPGVSTTMKHMIDRSRAGTLIRGIFGDNLTVLYRLLIKK